MLVTLFGIVTLLRLEQSANALSPMLVTLFGIVTLVRLEQYQNALYPMLVTFLPLIVDGIVKFVAEPLYLVISTVPSLRVSYL